MTNAFRLLIAIAFVVPGRAVLAGEAHDDSDRGTDTRVDVVVDLTDAGKKIAPPTPDKPAYFLPIFVGYKEEGNVLPGFFQNPPPPSGEVEKIIFKALAGQGYHVMAREHRPTLVLTIWWGYIAPEFVNTRAGYTNPYIPPASGMFVNENEMLTLTLGENYAYDRSHPSPAAQEALSMARYPRWYMMASASDFNDWLHHKTTVLWRAHISTSLWGHYLEEVLPTMIATGVPMFGRQTIMPQMITAPVIPAGRVILGTPEVKGFPAAPATDKK